MKALNKACIDMIRYLRRKRSKIKSEHEKFKSEVNTLKQITIDVKGYEVSSESDLQELYGWGTITEKAYKNYTKQLRDLQRQEETDFKEEYYMYLEKIVDRALKDISWCMEDDE